MIYGILSSIVRTFFKENYVEILQMYCTWKVTEKGKDSLGNVVKIIVRLRCTLYLIKYLVVPVATEKMALHDELKTLTFLLHRCLHSMNIDTNGSNVFRYLYNHIGDNILTKSSNVKININNICNLINHIK
jgi:hypothetical protein